MSALPFTRTLDSSPSDERFWIDLAALELRYTQLWSAMSSTPPTLGRRIALRRQLANARAARRLIDFLTREIADFPTTEAPQSEWRKRIENRLREFGEHHLGWPSGYRRLLFADAYFDSSTEFTRRARAFDPTLEPHEIGQAIRNVWIMNSLQMLLDRPVELTRAMFAYSMLYPETDNYLDDPSVPSSAKRRFAERLGRRLRGGAVTSDDARQQRVFHLVGLIEEDWSRADHAEVYLSLLAIHRAQVRSLAQDDPDARPSRREILALSVAKGGASVLADGYLVAGRLSPAEADFCFGYGVFLQLLDDLQDLESDRAVGHATMFSHASGDPSLDTLTAKLHRLIHRVIDSASRFEATRYGDLKDLIVRNCTMLLVTAVADQPTAFSPRFRRGLQRAWPLRFAAMRRLRRRAERRFRQACDTMRERHGVASVIDLL